MSHRPFLFAAAALLLLFVCLIVFPSSSMARRFHSFFAVPMGSHFALVFAPRRSPPAPDVSRASVLPDVRFSRDGKFCRLLRLVPGVARGAHALGPSRLRPALRFQPAGRRGTLRGRFPGVVSRHRMGFGETLVSLICSIFILFRGRAFQAPTSPGRSGDIGGCDMLSCFGTVPLWDMSCYETLHCHQWRLSHVVRF